MADENPLTKDLEAFNKQLPELQKQQTGKFAVFVDGVLEAVADTVAEAYNKGFAKAGATKPFLVKQISTIPTIQHFTRMVTSTLREVRSNQPKVTLREAQQQAERVMEAARHSPHRSRR